MSFGHIDASEFSIDRFVQDLVSVHRRLSPNVRGAVWMLISSLTFTVMTTLIKFLGSEYPAALQTFYRQAAGLLVMLPLMVGSARTVFRTTRPGIIAFRSLAGTAGMILAFYAYQELPLGDANALSFTRTLWMVPLAAFVLGEYVGPRRIAATIVGFVGVLLMVRPSGAEGLGWPTLAALVSALLLSFTVTGMKVLTRDHSTLTMMAWATVLGLLLAIPPALFVWRWPSLVDLGLLAAMGVLGIVTQACFMKGMAAGEAIVLSPIDYTRLIFALIVGFFVFEEIPNVTTLIGAGVIIGSTLYITVREQRLERSQKLSSQRDPAP